MLFIDTHIAVWLYNMSLTLLSEKAKQMIEKNDVFISPIVFLEIEYLYEIGKIKEKSENIIDYLIKKIDLKMDDELFSHIINIAANEKWTRDPFDRIIVSHAKYRDAWLITKDALIKKNYKKSFS